MIKTVTLSGSELAVEGLGGFNTFVQNLGSGVIYASKCPGIKAGADNVAEIPAGGGKLISTTNGTIYLLGTGKAELTGVDSDGVIATSGASVYNVSGGGSEGVSGASGASFMEFVGYADTHDEITLKSAKEYADLTAQVKADKTEIPTALPADGGNSATVNGFRVMCDVPEDAVFTDTLVDISGKMDADNPVCTGTFSMQRKTDTTIGKNSVTLGHICTATGQEAFAMGNGASANGLQSFAWGKDGQANGKYSYIGGSACYANGKCSHAEGDGCYTNGNYSIAVGLALHNNRHYSAVFGCYNKYDPATDDGTETGSIFVIGNGTANVSAKRSNIFRIEDTGEVYATGAFNTGGADYAEYIKPWFDENKSGEDRRGYFVTVSGGKLFKAQPGDYIVGITSGNPSVIGNGDEDWSGRWLRDDFDSYIYEETEIETDGAEKTLVLARKQNPDYDPELRYIPRSKRPEWSAVGMIGVLSVRDDGSCVPGGFAKCGAGGIATNADEWECHKTFFVIERVSDNIVKVEMR